MSTTITPAAEKPADVAEADAQPDTPAATDEPASDELDATGGNAPAATDGDEDQDQAADGDEDQDQADGDTFPRKVVEKLRKQNASLRDRARTAEAAMTAMQQRAADEAIKAAGLRPAAVWAVAALDDVTAQNGTVDAAKLNAAMTAAREQLGVGQPRRSAPRPGAGSELRSGAGVPQQKPRGFAAAFGPPPN
ncbi:hypothetical protein [Mycolicibacterium gilvum]|uniref:hypothetical protein n=1 Tax=Mycolicibacterium gilvum TaxID=1804 RepID=UPI0040457026